MRDLFGDSERYWYSLVSAAPVPESGERVNIAILVGNGVVTALEYEDRLPRLTGIAAADEINVYRAVLESVSDRVRGERLRVESVRGFLAPQIHVSEPRELARIPDDALLARLVARFCNAPRQPSRDQNLDALVTKSVAKLDDQIAHAKPTGVLVQKDVRPGNLYEGKLDRHLQFRVPKLSRAFRGMGRDVLMDSLVIENAHDRSSVREAASRIDQAFYAYDVKLRSMIKQYANRDVRLVGVLQPLSRDASNDTRELREYIQQTWARHARVIDGESANIERELRELAEWVKAA